MARARRIAALASLLSFEAAALAFLHQLGRFEWLRIDWTNLGTWMSTATAEDALAAVIRVAALAAAYWMTASTLLYLLAKLVRLPAAIGAVEWATLPAIRRVVDGALAVTIAAGTVAGPVAPALAEPPVPVVVEVDEHGGPLPNIVSVEDSDDTLPPTDEPGQAGTVGPLPFGAARAGWSPTPAGLPGQVTPEAPAGGASQSEPPAANDQIAHVASTAVRSTHEVVAGDHLWSIAADHLARNRPDSPGESEIARYWRRVIDANRDRLRSGDPDLIFPGELIELPPIE